MSSKGTHVSNRASSYLEAKESGLQETIAGFAWLIRLAQRDVSKKSALLAIPHLKMVPEELGPILGKRNATLLADGKTVDIDIILTLTLMTERKAPTSWPGPLLALHPSRKLLDLIDGIASVTDLLVVTGRLWSIQEWIDTWRVAPLGVSPLPPPRMTISPVLEVALKSLTLKVNLAAGLKHPSDRAATVSLFQTLHKGGFPFDPKEVRAWLVSQAGWMPSSADEAQQIAQRVLEGRQVRIERYSWGERILEIWEAQARKDSTKSHEQPDCK